MDFLNYRFDNISLIIGIVFASIIVLQIAYYIIVYCRTCSIKKNKKLSVEKPSISVVLYTRNESYNLQNNLANILEQEYPNFEVVVVNDASEDDTEYVLKVLQEVYPHLKIVNLHENVNTYLGKKFPLALGFRSSSNEVIVLTDAETTPTSYKWLDEIAANFTPDKDVVIAYTAIKPKKGLLNSLIQYDNHTQAMNYLGNAKLGNPYMGIGKNLAFRRKLFFDYEGFVSFYSIPVGEDDVLINKIANRKNTNCVISSDSINISKAKRNMFEFGVEKKRRAKARKYFKFKDRLVISFIPFTTFLLYAGLALCLIIGIPWQYVIVALIIRYTTQIIIYHKSSKILGTKKIAIFAPIFELYFIFYNTIIELKTLFRKGNKWN